MADELALKVAECQKKMFGDMNPTGGISVLLVYGQAHVTSNTPKVIVRKQE